MLTEFQDNVDAGDYCLLFNDGAGIADEDGEKVLEFFGVDSATQKFQMTNGKAGTPCELESTGPIDFKANSTMQFLDVNGQPMFRVTTDEEDDSSMGLSFAGQQNPPSIGTTGTSDIAIAPSGASSKILLQRNTEVASGSTLTGSLRHDGDPGGVAGTVTMTDVTGTTGSVRPSIAPPSGFTTTNWVKGYLGTTPGYFLFFT